MSTSTVARLLLAGFASAFVATLPIASASAQTPAPAAKEELTPEEIKERDARKDCKIKICAAFHNRKPDGGDISCSVLKS